MSAVTRDSLYDEYVAGYRSGSLSNGSYTYALIASKLTRCVMEESRVAVFTYWLGVRDGYLKGCETARALNSDMV